jgi:hypothetical protein
MNSFARAPDHKRKLLREGTSFLRLVAMMFACLCSHGVNYAHGIGIRSYMMLGDKVLREQLQQSKDSKDPLPRPSTAHHCPAGRYKLEFFKAKKVDASYVPWDKTARKGVMYGIYITYDFIWPPSVVCFRKEFRKEFLPAKAFV